MAPRRTRAGAAALAKRRAASAPGVETVAAAAAMAAVAASQLGGCAGAPPSSHTPPLGASATATIPITIALAAFAELTAQQHVANLATAQQIAELTAQQHQLFEQQQQLFGLWEVTALHDSAELHHLGASPLTSM
mmetsp:Transcript_15269/g.36995  ORF Transcript_15269/g.36995 Transcript_15269/m.36995 type:complete len:135 (+) Transcript_15269:264-668(+)